MTSKFKTAAVGVLIAAAVGQGALAHHSAAMFDPAKQQTFTGTVQAFNWVNPHVSVQVMAEANGSSRGALWTLEASSPGVMTRLGWTKRSVNPGDKVTVDFNPLRNGELGGRLLKLVTPDGKSLYWSLDKLPEELR
jgi:hypothetical protein